MLYNITYLTTVKLYKSLFKKKVNIKFISYNLIFYYTLQKKKCIILKKIMLFFTKFIFYIKQINMFRTPLI